MVQTTMGQHRWNFSRFGGVTQVLLKNAEDITHLRSLDLKLWTVLAMPTQGIFLDPKTIALLDGDKDGFIRPPEILAAADWLCEQFVDLSLLMDEGDSVPLAAIKNDDIRSSARWLLDHIHKEGVESVCAADIETQKKFFDAAIAGYTAPLPADGSDEEKLTNLVNTAAAAYIASGTPQNAIAEAVLQSLAGDAKAFLAWQESMQDDAILPLGAAQTEAAATAFAAVKEKIEDYFLRCTLTEYAPDKTAALSADQAVFQQVAAENISSNNALLVALPIAAAAAGKPLPLNTGINPAWSAALDTFTQTAVVPFFGKKDTLTESEFAEIAAKLTPYQACVAKKPTTPVTACSVPFLTELAERRKDADITALVQQVLAIETERGKFETIEKLVLLRRDFITLLKNYISFSNFYEGKGSVFQAGVLYFDSRAADLCFELNSDARHATLDSLSGAYLVYCDISRKGSDTKKIVALFTNGDSDNIVVGRNGVFYDRAGKDWNAVITKITANSISVRQAFFMPYKQLAAMIESQIAARATAGEAKSAELLSKTAATVATADKNAASTAAGTAPSAAKKLDLGTLALIGTALGGISALIGSILQALFGLGFWVPLGLIGILLCISGPSMILASMKLRKRSIAPILEANGWAVNIRTRINIPFGTQLTKLAVIPFGSIVMPIDPFADKKNGRKILVVILGLAAAGTALFCYLEFGLHIRFSDIPQYLQKLFQLGT